MIAYFGPSVRKDARVYSRFSFYFLGFTAVPLAPSLASHQTDPVEFVPSDLTPEMEMRQNMTEAALGMEDTTAEFRAAAERAEERAAASADATESLEANSILHERSTGTARSSTVTVSAQVPKEAYASGGDANGGGGGGGGEGGQTSDIRGRGEIDPEVGGGGASSTPA